MKSRQITWFNPPFNAAVTTDIGKQFLKLLDKHFHKNHPLGKLLNRNTVKISYSCTKNIKSIISSHNAKVMNADEQEPPREGKKCSCQRRNKHKNALLTTTAKDRLTSYTMRKCWMGLRENRKNMWGAQSTSKNDGTATQNLSGMKEASKKEQHYCPTSGRKS